ncbi:RNA 2',3'-cyclic phosphodiesterase [Nocardioides montaniterrae]
MGARIFAAIVPPDDVIEHLDDFLEVRREAEPAYRWTPAGQLHLTLAFMESVEERRIDDYVDRLADGVARTPVPEIALAGPVTFPNPAQARVLGVGVSSVSDHADVVLERLAGRARNAAVVSGIEVDGARFKPHCTIARLRRPTEVTRWVRLLETYAGPSWPVYEIAIIASHLGEGAHGGPRYETLAEVVLGG